MIGQTRSTSDRFRPDVEGLRAVAVLLVVLFHAGVPGFSGGFVGVDVFYVISGFLISGLIFRELRDTGTFSLSSFYARRARRILPAAGLVLGVTLVASVLIVPVFQVRDIATDVASAALYVSNMRFGAQASDYFQQAAPSPVLHYWSLSVEEQFYIVWPTLLLFAYRQLRPGTRTRNLSIVVATVGLASLALSVWLTGVDRSWAFYLLPTRAWELASGGVIATTTWRLREFPRRIGAPMVAGGLVLIGLSAVMFDGHTPFPGVAALLPVTGAAFVILGGLSQPATLASRLLALRPFRFFGRISYSLYLWHWPLIVLPAAWLGAALPLPAAIGLMGVAVVLATATQRWVEEPLRTGKLIGKTPAWNLAQAGALSLVIVLACGLAGWAWMPRTGPAVVAVGPPVTALRSPAPVPTGSLSPGASLPAGQPSPDASHSTVTNAPDATGPGPTPFDLIPPLADVRNGANVTGDCGTNDATDDPKQCVWGNPAGPTTVVVFGDSHAGMWFPAINALATRKNWRFVSLVRGSCPSFSATVWDDSLDRPNTECDDWLKHALARIAAEKPDLVVLSNSVYKLAAGGQKVAFGSDEWWTLWPAALLQMAQRVGTLTPSVVTIGETPQAGFDVPTCLAKNLPDVTACDFPREGHFPPDTTLASERAAMDAIGGTFVDPTPWLCSDTTCFAVIPPYIVYRDTDHFTTEFAASLTESLGSVLLPLIRGSTP